MPSRTIRIPRVRWVSVRRIRALLRPGSASDTLMTFLLAGALALGTSTQYFAQLFVWREWPLAEVFEGWLYVLRDRLIIAFAIAAALVIRRLSHGGSLTGRAGSLALAILLGAASGEWAVGLLYGARIDLGSWAMSALRFSGVALAIAATYFVWRASVESRAVLRREDLRRQSVEQQLTNTRLNALRKQIEPHFLFNTLATVRRLHQTSPREGAAMLANFIDYLARLLPMIERSEITLADEVELVQAYLAIIQLRMLERMRVRIAVPVELRQMRIPPLSLATLVENAIKHGITPLPSGGSIEVGARITGAFVEVGVRDNGRGLTVESSGGSGIGLYNVRARLQTLYGSSGTLHVEPNEPTGVYAYLRLPLERLSA